MSLTARILKTAAAATAVAALVLPVASAQLLGGPRVNSGSGIILYDLKSFDGEGIQIDGPVDRLNEARFNDRASSVRVLSGRWEICSDAYFRGHCEIVGRDSYDLNYFRLNNNISSVRPARAGGYGPRGDRPRGHGGYGPGADRNDGLDGARSVFFPRPTYHGNRIEYRRGEATRFCRNQGLGKALHVEENRRGNMIDVLCEK